MKAKGKVLAEVSPREGFLPKFAAAFTSAHGGVRSRFVTATSDYFTEGLARLQSAHGLRHADDPVAKFAPMEAMESLTKLLHVLYASRGREEVSLTLMNEAFGERPEGSFARIVDSVLGESFFSSWVADLENSAYVEADQRLSHAQ